MLTLSNLVLCPIGLQPLPNASGSFSAPFPTLLLKQYPNYVVELLLQLTCCVEGTSGDDSDSWLRAVILCQQCPLFIYNKECDV